MKHLVAAPGDPQVPDPDRTSRAGCAASTPDGVVSGPRQAQAAGIHGSSPCSGKTAFRAAMIAWSTGSAGS